MTALLKLNMQDANERQQCIGRTDTITFTPLTGALLQAPALQSAFLSIHELVSDLHVLKLFAHIWRLLMAAD